MESDDEAFPNAKHLFRQAFAVQDPAPLLLYLLKEHPTYPPISDLVFCYVEAVQSDPLYCAKTLASAIPQMHLPFGQDTLWTSQFRDGVGALQIQIVRR